MLSQSQSDASQQPYDLSSLCLAVTHYAPLPMATMEGAAHTLRYANPSFCRLMDRDSEKLLGKTFAEILPGQGQCLTLLDRVYRTGKSEDHTQQQHPEPHPLFWSYTMWPVREEKYPAGVMIQVTETAKFHEQAAAINEQLVLAAVRQHELIEGAENSNAQLQTEIASHKKTAQKLAEKARLLDLSLDAIIVHTFDNKITSWNKGAEILYGWTFEEVTGMNLHSLLQTQFAKPMAEIVAQLHREGQFSGEVVQTTRDGRRLPMLCRDVLDVDTQSILTSYTDNNERRYFEEERELHLASEQASRMEAEAANRSKDLFLATLSHEVRTPLNAILGWATILRSGNCDAAELSEGMEVIERNCKVQAHIIEDILDISRIVSGKLRLQIGPCQLAEVINAAIDVVRPTAAAKGVRFETELDLAASGISCDANRMQQVVWNLLTNAVRFTPRGKTIRITLSREHSMARIQVIDEGLGISAEFLPFVFDRFRQADSSSRRKLGGLGLGLSIVKHIMEVHGGSVRADSAGEGLGATFTVNLPIRAVHDEQLERESAVIEAGEAPASDLAPISLDGLRVLVVDDEADARRLLAKVLGKAGATVTAAGSVDEALLKLDSAKPHVLLSDIAMPDRDGYDLIRQIRGAGHHAEALPAVALTAFAHKDDRYRALQAGFQVHVAKPVDPHELIEVIATLARRKAS